MECIGDFKMNMLKTSIVSLIISYTTYQLYVYFYNAGKKIPKYDSLREIEMSGMSLSCETSSEEYVFKNNGNSEKEIVVNVNFTTDHTHTTDDDCVGLPIDQIYNETFF
jgi:hypothetical protein